MGGIRKAKKTQKPKEPEGLKHTVQIRLYPTRAQACMLREHCREYIDCVNTIVLAHAADMLPDGFSTKDFTAPLPSAVKNQVIRDAQSVYTRSFELGRIPHLKKPFAQWNNQNWKIESAGTRSTKKGVLDGVLIIPMWNGTKTKQVKIRPYSGSQRASLETNTQTEASLPTTIPTGIESIKCCGQMPVGEKGILRIKKKEKWIADATTTLPDVEPVQGEMVMGTRSLFERLRTFLRS